MVMRILPLFLLISACGTPPKSGVLAAHCATTPVRESDITEFGFKAAPGKIVVMRIFATWCPYCKADLERMAKLFKDGVWSPDQVQVFLLAYSNHSENRGSFDAFTKYRLNDFGFPPGSVQVAYVDRPYKDLVLSKAATGAPLFSQWTGVPFAMVFGKDGRLAFRGHFTISDSLADSHYKFVTELQKESCPLVVGPTLQ